MTTGAARTQDISLNPQKLAGQCCKLKCCLSYELDAYIDARKSLPRVNEPLQALDGDYYLVSSDVLRGMMSFSTVKGAAVGNIVLPVATVREIIDMNRKGKKPDTIAGVSAQRVAEEEPNFVNMVGEDSITRFDRSRGGNHGGRKGRGGRNGRQNGPGGHGNQGDRDAQRTSNAESGEKRRDGSSGNNRPNRSYGNNRSGGGDKPGEPRQGGENRRVGESGQSGVGHRNNRRRHPKPQNGNKE